MYSPVSTQIGGLTLEKPVQLKHVIMLLPFNRNPSLHDTVSSVPESTGNLVSVSKLFQAGSNPVHVFTSVSERRKSNIKRS